MNTTTKKTSPRKSVAARKSAQSKAKVRDVAKRVAHAVNETVAAQAAIDASTPKGEAERMSAALDEKRALNAWIKGGKKGKRPSTVNMDAIDAEYKLLGERSKRSRRKSGDGTRGRKPLNGGAELRFVVDGKPIIDRHNRLAGISRATGFKGGKKLSTDQFRAWLKKHGVSEPDSTTWSVTLPNGVKVESRKDSAALRAASTEKKTPAAKTSTPRKSAAKRTSAAKKSAASSSTRGRKAA